MSDATQALLNLAPVPRLLAWWQTGSCKQAGPLYVARAPGRLDVMGGIADYSGSLVCEMPLTVAAGVAVQPRGDGKVVCASAQNPGSVTLTMAVLATEDPQVVRSLLTDADKWARYPVGCLWWVLQEHRKLGLPSAKPIPDGLTILLDSDVPLGGGVSSSAAIEVATMTACAGLLGVSLSPLALATACQFVENHVVGAPCGVMDQVASCMGQANAMLEILCQPGSDGLPAQVLGPVEIPQGYGWVGLFSGASHEVSGDPYTDARVASFMGQKILSTLEPVDLTQGMLARVDAACYVKRWRESLPVMMKGADFLQQFGGTRDKVTKVKPERVYRVRAATDHHVFEMQRVTRFVDRVKQAGRLIQENLSSSAARAESLLSEAGRWMYESHHSYSDNAGLGHPMTDRLVTMVRELGPRQGFFGAKITGGGSGGTVAILLRDDPTTHERLLALQHQYEAATGRRSLLFHGTSPGAAALGTAII